MHKNEKSQALAVFKAEQAAIASQVPLDQIMDPVNRRLMKAIAVKGDGVLSTEDLANVSWDYYMISLILNI